ncbi:MAG: PHP domain-containing protein [Synechococcales bacterium]|nr:PHP domain-containing protein [Synechococcales bacterium]
MAVVFAPVLTQKKPDTQDLAAFQQVLSSIHPESCPHSYNFHMHTSHSDGQLRPDILVDQAIEIGLQGFAITDHHQISGFMAAYQYLLDWQTQQENQDKPVPRMWTGIEITSQLLETEVHILGFAFDPAHPAIASYLTGNAPTGMAAEAKQVIAAIRQAGGIAVLAHPARYRKSMQDLIPAAVAAGIDGVETYYAYGNPKPWCSSPSETEQVEHLSQHYHLLRTCGTDTHGLNLLQRI